MAQSRAPSHRLFDDLLKLYVTPSGQVNYKGFIKDSVNFNGYLKVLKSTPPDEKTWTVNEQKAFWINAYNAFTIKLIIDHYPVKSIKNLGGGIYKVNTPWDIRFIKIGGETYDLNNIEHAKLRRGFDDPRIHFAIVCASKSCPKLIREAYNADQLDQQLDRAAKEFLKDTFRNRISSDRAEISSIFKWYNGDFTVSGTLVDYLNRYSPIKLKPNAKISYMDYNWSLNE